MLDRTRPTLCLLHDATDADPPAALFDVPDDLWDEVDLVQVRGKGLNDADLEALTRAWVARLGGLKPAVVVNDRLEVARAAGAAGVHLGADDLPLDAARAAAPEGFLLGASCHGRDELLVAQAAGADYAGLGAFFDTATKPGARPLDPWRTGLMETIHALVIPVLAIGGLTPERVEEALRVPAVTGVAVSAAVQRSADPAGALGAFRRALDAAWDQRLEPAHR